MRAPFILKTALAVAGIAALSACAHPHYVPVEPANFVPNERDVGGASVEGVVIRADVDTWKGDPDNLKTALTPVRVTIENNSNQPLSLRYPNFEVSNPAGVQVRALPPFQIHGSITESGPITPAYPWDGFMLYPGYGPYYGPGWALWGDNWGWDGGWYGTYWAEWQQDLPTRSMLEKAVPEGVLNPGGQVKGYLYFQKIPENVKNLVFVAELWNANTHQQIATVHIPFEKKG